MLVRESFHAYFDFGALVVNGLSVLWLAWLLAISTKLTNAEFGKLIRRESGAVTLALTSTIFYSVIRVFELLSPWPPLTQ